MKAKRLTPSYFPAPWVSKLAMHQKQRPRPRLLYIQTYNPFKHRSFFSLIVYSCRRIITIFLSSFSPTSLMPDIPPPPHHAFGRCRRSINGGPHVEVEDRLACGFWRGGVVVYHVADFAYGAIRGLALDVPVVAVKRRFAATSLPFLARRSKSNGE